MKFLIDYGVSPLVVDKIIQNNDEILIKNAEFDSEIVLNNIKYFESIGIKRIDDLLIERLDLFFNKTDRLKKEFNKLNISVSKNFIGFLLSWDVKIFAFVPLFTSKVKFIPPKDTVKFVVGLDSKISKLYLPGVPSLPCNSIRFCIDLPLMLEFSDLRNLYN